MIRTLLVLAVAALIAAMMVVIASPAFAKVDHLKLRTDLTHLNGAVTPSEKVNLSVHTQPEERQGGDGGGAERRDATIGAPGTVVETPSENLNGNFHGDCSDVGVNCP